MLQRDAILPRGSLQLRVLAGAGGRAGNGFWIAIGASDVSHWKFTVPGIIGVAVVALAVMGVRGWVSDSPKPAVSVAQALPPPSTVVARARIEPKDRVRVIHGHDRAVLRAILVREGDVVSKGDVLAELISVPVLAAKLALEERRLAEVMAVADQITAPAKATSRAAQQALMRQRQLDMEKAEQELRRAERLYQTNVVSVTRFSDRLFEYNAARYALSQSQEVLASLSEVREVDVRVAEAQVATQRAAVDLARADLDRAIIRAPINGTVLSVFARAGELLGEDGLLQMADMSALIAIAEVNELDMPRIAVGQTANIRSALFATPIEATVVRTSETIFKQRRPTSDVLVGRDARIAEIELLPSLRLPALIGAELTVEIQVR